MVNGFILALLASGQEPFIAETRCEWIEVNQVCSVDWCEAEQKHKTRVTLTQLIFWRTVGREECIAWRMENGVRFVSEGQGVSVVWHEGDGRMRRVRAKYVLFTATDYDVEIANRAKWPIEVRRGLGGEGEERIYPSLRIMRMKERM